MVDGDGRNTCDKALKGHTWFHKIQHKIIYIISYKSEFVLYFVVTLPSVPSFKVYAVSKVSST